MNEHTPIFSEVYAVPKLAANGQRPVRPAFPGGQGNPVKAGSPRIMGSALQPGGRDGSPSVAVDGTMSHVAVAALAEGSPASRGRSPRDEPTPIYETNSIGGRRRIAQSSSFNKLMMNVLGE